MSDTLRLTETLVASASYEDTIEAVLQTGDAAWRVDFEDVSIELEFDQLSGRLALISELGKPPADRRLEVYEALLSYSLLWRETGAVRVGLGGADGALFLLVDTGVGDLLPARLADILGDFADKVRTWRDVVSVETLEAEASDRVDAGAPKLWA